MLCLISINIDTRTVYANTYGVSNHSMGGWNDYDSNVRMLNFGH